MAMAQGRAQDLLGILVMVYTLQISSDMHQSDNLQKARRPTKPGVSSSVALLLFLRVVQLRTDL